ncbi:MAG TPA: CRISPR-associated endonuclease Cas3'', partial [Urbifossiella sp.]|nr:CRISPR-associated endonuclease Cas3'' [Urbifossiella sp.]
MAKAFQTAEGKYDWLKTARRVLYPGRGGVLLVANPKTGRRAHPDDRNVEADADDGPADDETMSFLGTNGRGTPAVQDDQKKAQDLKQGRQSDGRIALAEHCDGVRRRVDTFADRLGLTVSRATLSRAAQLHDAGKADARFQEWLFGNPVDAAQATEPIAKSGTESRDSATVESARRRAGWPKHARHEAMSVLLVQDNAAALAGAGDPGLLVHLIGTHHGRGRPQWPITLDDEIPDGAEVPEQVSCQLGGFE